VVFNFVLGAKPEGSLSWRGPFTVLHSTNACIGCRETENRIQFFAARLRRPARRGVAVARIMADS